MAAHLNAPELPADHPVNCVVPRTHCSKHPQVHMAGLKLGKRGALQGKVHHSCPLNGCDVMYVYTPGEPAAPAPVPAAMYGAAGQPIPIPYPPYFAPPGLPLPPGLVPAAPGLPAPPGALAPAAQPAPPPTAAAGAPPPAPPAAVAAAVPAHVAGSAPCIGGCRTASQRPRVSNSACQHRRCKQCCLRHLQNLERAGLGHNGCGAAAHSRRPVPAVAQPATPGPAAPSAQPGTGASLPQPVSSTPASADGPPAQPPDVPASAPEPTTAASPAGQGTLIRPLALSWQAVEQQQAQMHVTYGHRRSKFQLDRTRSVTVVVWYRDDEEPRQFLVAISQGARFSLHIDGGDYLKEFGITSTFFDHYMNDTWVRIKVDLLLHVPDSHILLFRLPSVLFCLGLSRQLDRLYLGGDATSQPSVPSLPARKRLGEPVVSPLRQPNKRARSGSVHPPSPHANNDFDPFSDPPSPVSVSPPRASVLASTVSTSHPPPPSSCSALPVSPPPDVPDSDDEQWLGVPVRKGSRESKFPGDVALSDLIRALKNSERLAAVRKRQRTTEPHCRMEIIAKMFGVASVSSTTVSTITKEINDAKDNFPTIYAVYKSRGQSDLASMRLFRNAIRKAKTELIASRVPSVPVPSIVTSTPAPASPSPPPPISPVQEHRPPGNTAAERAPQAPYRWSDLKIDYETLSERIASYHDILKEIAEDARAHDYCAQLQDAVRACRAGAATASQVQLVEDMKTVKAGYYGYEGYTIAHLVTMAFQRPSFYTNDLRRAILPLSLVDFHTSVIVREVFLLLIQDDLGVDEEEAVDIYEESSRVVGFDDPDERSLHSDSDSDGPLVPRTASERLLASMAAKRRQELREEEGEEVVTESVRAGSVPAVKAEPEDARIPSEAWSITEQEEDGKVVYVID